MKRLSWIWALGALAALLLTWGGTAAGAAGDDDQKQGPELSGIAEFRDVDFGTDVTECPQAGLRSRGHGPNRRLERDRVEALSSSGNDIRVNQDYSCFPQDEMSIAVNPLDAKNALGGANDYRLGFGTSGFYATTNRGEDWYDGIIPYPSIPTQPIHGPGATGEQQDGGGDPAVIFDRTGVGFWVDINFNRDDDTNGIYAARSTNGGWTWSRPCVPVAPVPPATEATACASPGDSRQVGDGVVTHNQDNNLTADGSIPFDDKEYVDAGPRPDGVQPTCFTPTTRTPIPVGTGVCTPARISPDRLYVTWTRFGPFSQIMVSYSDDRGRSWSAARVINGSAAFCSTSTTECRSNQGSQPVVHPITGVVYVTFQNNNTPDENQYLLVRSNDGGQTWQGPFFVTSVFDVNYPTGSRNRPDCVARGQGATRLVLTNSCYRVNGRGALVADKRGGAYADDLYVITADNRNGTVASTNTDVRLFKSIDGGVTWVGPTRVNDDPSAQPANRDCGRNPGGPEEGQQPACPPALGEGAVNTGNDQFFPWLDIGEKGDLQIVWQDRRLDRDSLEHEWPTSRQRLGNYLHWFWGGQCRVERADSRECTAPTAGTITQPSAPVNPLSTATFPEQTVFPFRNFGISDHPFNWDYCFRAGIFCGDYENVFVDQTNRAWAMWTDARNGRSSRNQPGRNPICEQSDAFLDIYGASSRASGQNSPRSTDSLYLVTPCPADHGPGEGDDDFDDD